MTIHFVTNEKVAETSSKGNQEKWLDKETNKWYKLDQFGYEALSEVLISKLLEYSNIEADTDFTFTRYEPARINVHGFDRTGCVSKNFLKENQSIITISRLFAKVSDTSLKTKLDGLSSDKKRIAYLADATAEYTNLKRFPQYLTLLFEIDSLFLNDDRHLNNIAVIEENGKFCYCPIFDNGAGLLSDTRLAPLDISTKAIISKIKARPFNTTFNRQMNTIRSLYGPQLQIPKFKRECLSEQLEPLLEYYPVTNSSFISDRVIECIMQRQKFI